MEVGWTTSWPSKTKRRKCHRENKNKDEQDAGGKQNKKPGYFETRKLKQGGEGQNCCSYGETCFRAWDMAVGHRGPAEKTPRRRQWSPRNIFQDVTFPQQQHLKTESRSETRLSSSPRSSSTGRRCRFFAHYVCLPSSE